MLVIRRIRVRYRLAVEPGGDRAATARRVHDVHRAHCPVYRTISGCVAVATELELVEEEPSA